MSFFRTGDHVKHLPTGEEWVVAWCDLGDLAWCGWPDGIANTADCLLIKKASDDEHKAMVREVIASGGPRGDKVRRMYPDIAARAAKET